MIDQPTFTAYHADGTPEARRPGDIPHGLTPLPRLDEERNRRGDGTGRDRRGFTVVRPDDEPGKGRWHGDEYVWRNSRGFEYRVQRRVGGFECVGVVVRTGQTGQRHLVRVRCLRCGRERSPVDVSTYRDAKHEHCGPCRLDAAKNRPWVASSNKRPGDILPFPVTRGRR